MHAIEKARIAQVRVAAAVLRRSPLFVTKAFHQSPFGSKISGALLGYRGVFASLADAEAAIARYANGGHESEFAAQLHLELSRRPRASDYAAMFHLRPLIGAGTRVVDLGGNVGNLFYCYSDYLPLAGVNWQVLDLPETAQRGALLAEQKRAHQIHFIQDWPSASGADILLVSGAMQYFDEPLPDMVNRLSEPPRHILINRSPMTNGRVFATAQEAGSYRVACKVYNRSDLIGGFTERGYELVDIWDCNELALSVPGHPECNVPSYSGMYFVKR